MTDVGLHLQELKEKIRLYDTAYYVRGEALVSDREYDTLYAELVSLEKQYPDYVSSDSPTQRVASDLTKEFAKVKHAVPMMSIDNTYSEPDVLEWVERVKKLVGSNAADVRFMGELKVDGVALSLVYEQGKLVHAVTRGDGTTGDDVTANVRTIRSIPLCIDCLDPIEVRGEVYLTFKDFQALNDSLIERGEKPMQNPRNTTSGTIKQLDPKEVDKRNLSFSAYFLLSKVQMQSHSANLLKLESLGFPVVMHSEPLPSSQAVIEFLQLWNTKRHDLGFPVDGAVVKVDSIAMQEILGVTAKSPRWVIAYKYQPETAVTQVEAIDCYIGRTGVVTPVAKLSPVLLAGTTIRNASLYNFDEVKRLDVRVSDFVSIEKGGEIIPKITRVLVDKRSQHSVVFKEPGRCVSCGATLIRQPEEVALRCVNNSCPAQLFASISHFVSRSSMNIEGLGPALIAKLLEVSLIKNVADLYSLTHEQLSVLEGLGDKSAANIIMALDKSKQNPLDKLIHGLGIRMIGAQTARVLAMGVTDISDLYSMSIDRLMSFTNIGPNVAQSIRLYFDRIENIDLVNKLKDAGVNIKGMEKPSVNLPFSGKTFVLTGTMQRYSREDAKAIIEARGGHVSSSVSAKTHFVVAGEEAGSKLDKAKKLNVRVLTEEEFLEMIL